MQNLKDHEKWKARWARQKAEWQLQALERFTEAPAQRDELATLLALIKLASDQMGRGPD